MRKLSTKWPWTLTLIGFCYPISYMLFRITHPENFVFADFADRVVGCVLLVTATWGVYLIACLFARTWVSCRYCCYSEAIEGSQEIKCRLTGYEYPTTYSCVKSRPKEAGTELLESKHLEREYDEVHCKGCGKLLTKAQIDYMLGNPKYNEWCREGFCRLACFEKYKKTGGNHTNGGTNR